LICYLSIFAPPDAFVYSLAGEHPMFPHLNDALAEDGSGSATDMLHLSGWRAVVGSNWLFCCSSGEGGRQGSRGLRVLLAEVFNAAAQPEQPGLGRQSSHAHDDSAPNLLQPQRHRVGGGQAHGLARFEGGAFQGRATLSTKPVVQRISALALGANTFNHLVSSAFFLILALRFGLFRVFCIAMYTLYGGSIPQKGGKMPALPGCCFPKQK
jgi:hypothetical protein